MFGASYIATSHLVKRSSELVFNIQAPIDDVESHITGFQYTVLFLTGLFGGIFLTLLQYTFKLLLTLTVVEEPPSVYLPLNSDSEALNADSQPHLVNQENQRVFITSSIRGTIRHLRREGGFWAPWRGFWANFAFSFVNAFLRMILIGTLQIILPLNLATIIGGIASMVCLSRFALVCTHIMISAPDPNHFWTRLMNTSWAQAKKTIPAVVIWASALQFVAELIVFSIRLSIKSAAGITLLTFSILLYILIAIPATILLIRVQASVLADDVATIVPFDKTFGQDTSDSDGVLTVQKAIKSINHAVFRRVCIFLAKSVPALLAINVVFLTIYGLMFMAWVNTVKW